MNTIRHTLPMLLGTLLAAGLPGCDDPVPVDLLIEDAEEISPALFWDLSPERKAEIRTTVIHVPELFGFAELPPNRGPWASRIDRLVHEGETDFFAYQLARTMFEFEHPTILVEFMAFDMWGTDFKALLATSLHSRRSPAMYIARSLPETMVDGWYADITDYLDDWPAARDHPATRASGTFDGRIYCIPGQDIQWPVIVYRKDFFEEAGILNEYGEPGPPSDWTWSDFRRYAKMLTRDTTGDGRIDRWGFIAEQHRFDLYYTHCNVLMPRLIIPDRAGEYVWRFNADDPKLIEGIKAVREMYWVDRSVLTGVHYNWLTKEGEFRSDKAAMATATSVHPPLWALTAPDMFPGDAKTIDILGVVPIPRADPVGADAEGVLYREAPSNLYGFNPLYTPEQLRAAVAWFRSWACGYTNFLTLTTLQRKNEIWGRPDTLPLQDLTAAYEQEVPLPPSPGREYFPREYRAVYDIHDALEMFPRPTMYGLPPVRQFGDAFNNLFSELLFMQPRRADDGTLDEAAEETRIRRALRDHASRIHARCMNQRIDDDDERREIHETFGRYYDALADFARRNMPPDAAAELQRFIENHRP